MKIAAIIVNYRTAELTAKVTAALLLQLDQIGEFHLYLVDNCSGDGSVEQLRARAETEGWGARVTVVAAPRNGGYGYGINIGVQIARAHSNPPGYYFVLNSDAFVDAGAVGTMLTFMDQHPDAGLCGADIHGTDGTKQGSAFRFPTAASEFRDTAKTKIVTQLLPRSTVCLPLPDRASDVEWISGACLMIRREACDQIGFFDEGFFLYFEEVDYCRRARRAGWRSYCVPAASVTHVGSVSTGMNDQSRRVPDYWFQSRHRYIQKHHGRSYAALCDVCWIAGFVIQETKSSILRRRWTNPPHMLRDFVRNSLQMLVNPRPPGRDDVVHAKAEETDSPTHSPAADRVGLGNSFAPLR